MDIKRVLHGYFRSLIFYFAWWWELVMRYCLFLFVFFFSSSVLSAVDKHRSHDAPGCEETSSALTQKLKYRVAYAASYTPPRKVVVVRQDVTSSMGVCNGYLETREVKQCPPEKPIETPLGCVAEDDGNTEKNYCDTPEAQQAIEDGIRSCPNQSGSGTCNRDTQQIEITCDKEPGGEEPNPEEPNPEEPKPEDPNDLCNTTPRPAFCDESDADGGGEGGSGEDGDGGGVEGVSEFCKEHPELCPPYEEPNPEEPQDETDLIAAIAKITKKLNDQHHTQIENRVNTTNIATNTAKQLDKSETIKDNTKVIADNTNKATDHLKAVDERIRNSNRLLTQNARDLDTRLKELTETVKNKPNGGGSNFNPGHDANVEGALDEIVDSSKLGFCEKNPNHESCITKSAKASACEPFSCTGEPVLCQLLKIEYDEQCNKPDFKSVEGSLNKIVGDGEPSQLINPDPLDFTNPDTKYLSNGLKLSAKCPAPVKASVLGETIEFSYQPLCDLAVLIRPFVIGISWVVAAFVVGRGVSNL